MLIFNRTSQKRLLAGVFAALVCLLAQVGLAQTGREDFFAGQDLHLIANRMTTCKSDTLDPGRHLLIFDDGFSMSIGDNQLSGNGAVVWLRSLSSKYRGQVNLDYNCQVYLQGNVTVKQGKAARTTDLNRTVVDQGQALVVRFLVSGEVFATAQIQSTAGDVELRGNPLYQNALASIKPVRHEPTIVPEAMVPGFGEVKRPAEPMKPTQPAKQAEPTEPAKTKKKWRITDVFKPKQPKLPEPEPETKPEPKAPVEEAPKYEYPVNLSGVWGIRPEITKTTAEDGSNVVTIIGRFYLWQKRDEKGTMMELQVDNAVIFYGSKQFRVEDKTRSGGVFASGSIEAIYLNGNIVITEGPRTIRAEEGYYDFRKRQALMVKAVMRNFDIKRGLPIYLRAEKLRQVSENLFQAEEITLTTSEFYLPQVSSTAAKMVLTDTTAIDARTGREVDKSSYDGILYDMRMKFGEMTVFKWPKLRTNLERPDIPLRRIQVGRDSEFGTSVESRWHLSRLLGRKEPEGVDSTLAVDYFGKRGAGVGADIAYHKQDYYGRVIGYVLKDRGTDDLSRSRQNVAHGEDYRGRFRFQHRHYLPYDWQATVEVSYASDKNFIEWFNKSEFDTGKAQETVVHLKRLKENWAFSILNKFRITKHREITEELPTLEFHLKGASFWDHKLTFYSDSQVSRLRDRLGEDTARPGDPQQFYTFASTRNEVDMPFMWNTLKVVPFLAGTYGLEDQKGYNRKIDGITANEDASVWFSEVGIRLSTMFWKEDKSVKSRLWDINGIRHIVKPHLEAIMYQAEDATVEMRDVVNFGISQRWQTRRGPKDNLRNLDWMRLEIDATWLSDEAESAVGPISTYGPAKFIWNDPSIPIFNRKSVSRFGMLRNSINADYIWRLSDTATLLSDINYDIKSSVVQQFDIGVSRYVYPNLSYYIGNRYLRPVIATAKDGFEKGSNSVIAAVTYVLNPRYTVTFAQEYNFDYGKNIRSRVTFLRHYHRMYYGLTFSTDKSLDRDAVTFSIWPEGIKELAFGQRKYVDINPLISEQY